MHTNRVMRPRCVLALSAAVLMMASLTGCSPEPARPTPPTEGVAPAAAPAKPLERHGASGQVYRAIPSGEKETYEAEQLAAEAVSCTRWGSEGADVFDGCARRTPKTTMLPASDAAAEPFEDISALKATLQDDGEMIHHVPLIAHDADSERVAEEMRNVSVDAYLYAVAKESDRDFHLIVGDKDCDASACFLNAEVSALPKTAARRPPFETVREALVDMFGEEPGEAYWQIDPPAPIHIEGTLFYDIDHRPGAVGPSWAKPDKSWEIHPISVLALLDE